jgi:hypothetical protein
MIQITDREGCALVDTRPVIVWLYSPMVVPFGAADAGLWGLPQRGLRALTQIRARSGGNSRSAHRS